jgi:hypothetical protein
MRQNAVIIAHGIPRKKDELVEMYFTKCANAA